MRCGLVLCAVLISCGIASSQEHSNRADVIQKFEVGLRTFFDFGPPFNYYELFIVSASPDGTAVKRITITPPGDQCLASAKVEVASASINKSITELLDFVNPCGIPEKEIRREFKRCKKCAVFSGADVVMRFQCGAQKRLIRSSVLDRDWFSSSSKTPRNTSWSMALLNRLEQAVGPGVMNKPIFSIPADENHALPTLDPSTSTDLNEGMYDALFPGTERLSLLFQAATALDKVGPSVTLRSSIPFEPIVSVAPDYPKLARMARVEGTVSLQIEVDSNGDAINPVIIDGHPLLRQAVLDAIKCWKFPKDSANQQTRLIMAFNLNCH